MEIQSILLCDFAQVREGLLFVLSAGITRLAVPEVPAPFALSIAVQIELEQTELSRPHQLVISVRHNESASVAYRSTTAFQLQGPTSLEPGESMMLPVVADLRAFGATHYGAHDVKVEVDDHHQRRATFYLVRTPTST